VFEAKDVTELGIVIDVSDVHIKNAAGPISVTLLGSVMDVRAEHSLNAASCIVSVLAPSVTDARLVHPLNALFGMIVRLFGMTTDSIDVLAMNRPYDIPDMRLGSVISPSITPRYPTATPALSTINPVSCVPNIRSTSESPQNAEGSPTSLVVSVIAHPPNAKSPMAVTEAGNVTEDSEEQFANSPPGMYAIPLDSVIFVIFVHPTNAPSPFVSVFSSFVHVRVDGRTIDVKDVQFINAFSPRVVTLSGMVTLNNPVAFKKTSGPIPDAPGGIVKIVGKSPV
jgi:hypothetical protein